MAPKRAAVVGAGPCGLAATRHAILNGFDVEIFDRRDSIGGRWSDDNTHGPFLHKQTTTQYSAIGSSFSDFPLSTTKPLTKLEAGKYLLDYAEAFGLDKKVRLNTEVVEIRRHADYEQTGRWTLKYTQNGAEKLEEFDVVLVCTGFRQKVWRPNEFRMESKFKGKISFASDFKSTRGYENKTIVLVGFGNSAAQLARRLGPIANKIYIAARRGEWTWKQMDGKPLDLAYNTRLCYALRCLVPKYFRNFLWERESSRNFGYGQMPAHRFLATLPVFIEGLEEFLASGKVEIEDNLLSFTETGVEFKSGRVVETVDEVIFCTGYQFDLNFIEEGLLVGVHDNDFQMFLHMYPVELRTHPTLACIGLVQPQMGCLWPIAELQARLFFSVLNGNLQLPSVFEMRKDAQVRRCSMNLDFLRTRRHTHIEDFVGFSNELSRLIGAQPSIASLLLDPRLAWHYFTGPLTAQQYRLTGPHAWSGAREAVISAAQHAEFSIPNQVILIFVCIFLAFLLKLFIY